VASASRFAEASRIIVGLRQAYLPKLHIVPGCCSRLEDWHEWLGVPHGKNSIWAGHDPSPDVEYFEGRVRIWQDQKAEGVEFVEFGFQEMETLLKKVEQDLEGFLFQLGKWEDYISPESRGRLVDYFSEKMSIRSSQGFHSI
jgi:hypothetical protein